MYFVKKKYWFKKCCFSFECFCCCCILWNGVMFWPNYHIIITGLSCLTVQSLQNPKRRTRDTLPFCLQWRHGPWEGWRSLCGRHETGHEGTREGWLHGTTEFFNWTWFLLQKNLSNTIPHCGHFLLSILWMECMKCKLWKTNEALL